MVRRTGLKHLAAPAAKFVARRILVLADRTKGALEFLVTGKIGANGFLRRVRAGFPLNFLQKFTHGLLPFPGRIAEVNLSPATEVALQSGVSERVQFGREGWLRQFVLQIGHVHPPTASLPNITLRVGGCQC
jgi:hypothetical protein